MGLHCWIHFSPLLGCAVNSCRMSAPFPTVEFPYRRSHISIGLSTAALDRLFIFGRGGVGLHPIFKRERSASTLPFSTAQWTGVPVDGTGIVKSIDQWEAYISNNEHTQAGTTYETNDPSS